MKSIYRAALMAAAFLFLLPWSARSEIRGGTVEVEPFVGYNFFESSQNLKNNFMFGGRVGYNFTRYFGIEVAGEFIHTRVDNDTKVDATEGQFNGSADKVDATFYHVDAVYHIIPTGRFNPFIVAGIGGAHYSPLISHGDMPLFNVGIGAKYWFTDNIALRFDVQDNIVTEIFQETYSNLGVTLGIVFAFGGSKPAPAPVAKEEVVAAAAEPKIIVLTFEDIHFDFDKSTLKPEAQAILKRDVQKLKDNPNAKIRVAGYTSASGTEAYNQKLSERRANAVRDYLINEGLVTPDRLTIIGYGEKHPAEYETAPKELYSKAAKANMRVLFEIIVQ
ncbi:MAG: OmpA family protein [Smithellaceae bacterium]